MAQLSTQDADLVIQALHNLRFLAHKTYGDRAADGLTDKEHHFQLMPLREVERVLTDLWHQIREERLPDAHP
jgi:hypothetical protein